MPQATPHAAVETGQPGIHFARFGVIMQPREKPGQDVLAVGVFQAFCLTREPVLRRPTILKNEALAQGARCYIDYGK